MSFAFQSFKHSYTMDKIDSICDEVANIFDAYRKRPHPSVDLWDTEGRCRFKSKIRGFVTEGLPIPFVLPAFPYKSRNTKTKVV